MVVDSGGGEAELGPVLVDREDASAPWPASTGSRSEVWSLAGTEAPGSDVLVLEGDD